MIVPHHVVIIPDGNRRWAKQKNHPSLYGHREGYTRIKELISYAKEKEIKFLTVWAFSTENWKRKEDEVGDIFGLVKKGLSEIHSIAKKEKTKVIHIGRRDRIEKSLLKLMEQVEEETKQYKNFCLCLAIDYGGEDEIKRAEKKLQKSGNKNKSIIDFLDTTFHNVPKPDLIIRTGGEKRTSGFMPLQSCYSEYIFSDLLFPDFAIQEFEKVLDEYRKRDRRFGK